MIVRCNVCRENPNFLATAQCTVSFELVGQIAAPGFDSESILHRASTNRLIRMRMEAWVEGEQVSVKIPVDRQGPSHGSTLCPQATILVEHGYNDW